MVKRVQDQDADGRIRKKANRPGDNNTSSPSAMCEFCDHEFTARGLKNHQNYCKSKKAADKKPRCYKFCILNETLFEIILSFLNNQALTKMQVITGDQYPKCEPLLASCCCRCEEDNPAIQYGLCRECDAKSPHYKPSIVKKVAKEKYCLRDIDFKGIRYYTWGDKRYELKELEMRAMELYGSKLAWVREIAHRTKLAAEKQQRRDHLEALAPGFAAYVEDIKWKRRDKVVLKQASERFLSLKATMEERGLTLETQSKPCMEFITTGSGDIQEFIDTAEEKKFCFKQHSYWQLIREKEAIARASQAGNFHSAERRFKMERECEEDAKTELCIRLLKDNQGFTLPRKWESCRARLEEVTASGGDPLSMGAYIYAGIGGPPALQENNIESSAASAAQV